ncbi:hypothetical protein BV22DRAFT_1038069 [Leucogyrophana mollusca]|uniref:Uncharacterized protein n=1 Tax=Leucogyrophana mollusca TaxID=85980 RepID=A0ACB8BAU3_9AGAM|nr:hypothetical protein BV22DRAFT_1038069 [Leucogyrophana mollusca]
MRQTPRLFALIIGIDDYKSDGINNLLGAVADADAIKDYLEGLRDTSIQIRNLRNSEATRARILDEISAFMDDKDKDEDKRIQKGDPILIYYAGHGGESPSPPRWQTRGPKIQHLVPHDHDCQYECKNGCGDKCKDGCEGRKDGTVPGIPDRTLGALLTRLATEKGDNITVIFDCCHSGSGTRNDKAAPTRLVRGIKIKETPADDLDQDIWGAIELNETKNSRAIAPSAGFAQSGLLSHVLLAACGADEFAREEDKRGIFTSALIEVLKVGVNKLTYAELLQQLPPLSTQNPQCEGVNQNRILFNGKVASQGAVLYKIRKECDQCSKEGSQCSKEGDQHSKKCLHYKMEAGEAHGLSKSAQFAVYRDRDSFLNGSPLGTVVARSLTPFVTVLDAFPEGSSFELKGEGVAVQTRAGDEEDLRIHVAMDEKLVVVFQALSKEMQRTDPARRNIRLVEHGAELDIGLEGGRIVFNVLHAETKTLGLHRLWKSVDPTVEAVTPVINAAAHYFWHLRRTSVNKKVERNVKVGFFELTESDEDEGDSLLDDVLRPTGDNLITQNVIDLKFKDGANYGMEITNNLIQDLYVSVFYFDSYTLEITPWYEPPTAKGIVDPSVLGKRTLPIGFGDSGTTPRTLLFREPNQTLDVGFFKIFISTEYVNLSHVAQRTPFDKDRYLASDPRKVPAIWHTIQIPIRLRRTLE